MKNLKIRHLFIILVISTMLVSISVVGAISIITSTQSLKKEASEKLELLSINTGHDLDHIIVSVEQQTRTLANLIVHELTEEAEKSGISWEDEQFDLESIDQRLDSTVLSLANSTNDYNLDMYYQLNHDLFNPSNTEWLYTLYTRPDFNTIFTKVEFISTVFSPNIDPNDYPWYYTPKSTGKSLWLGPYYDVNLDLDLISFVMPMFHKNTFLGVVGMDISYKQLQEIVASTKVYDSGYMVLTDNDYNFLYHPIFDIEDNLRTVDNGGLAFMVNELKKSSTGSIDYLFRGNEKLLGYATLSNGWVVAAAPVEAEILKSITSMRNRIVATTLICFIIASTFAYIIGGQIAMPIESLTRFFKRVSGFDLSYDKSTLWLTGYKNEIGELANAIYKIIIDQEKIIENMQSTSKNLSEHAESTFSKMVDVQELAEDQSFSIRELKSAIEDIAKNTDKTDLVAEKLSVDIEEIHNQLSKLTGSISEQIEVISKDSSKITAQLNLLSENMVSEEIQTSNEENDSNSLFKGNDDSMEDMQTLNEHLLNFVEQSKAIQNVIFDLSDSYDQMNNYAQSIFISVEQQTANIEEVLATADSLSDMAVVIAQSSLSVRSETERLRNKSQALDRMVSKFKLSEKKPLSEVHLVEQI